MITTWVNPSQCRLSLSSRDSRRQEAKTMSDDGETKPAKKGRGRPPKTDSAKKAAAKRPAKEDEANGDVAEEVPAKKGRGRPKGSTSAKKTVPKKVSFITKTM